MRFRFSRQAEIDIAEMGAEPTAPAGTAPLDIPHCSALARLKWRLSRNHKGHGLPARRQPVQIESVALDIVAGAEVLKPTYFGFGDREAPVAIDEIEPSLDLTEPFSLQALEVS